MSPITLALSVVVPIIGLLLLFVLRRRMMAGGIADPPTLRLAAVILAYGALVLFGGARLLGDWGSGHAFAAAVLIAIGTPWLTAQGLVTAVRGMPTTYHRTVTVLSLAFPLLMVVSFLVLRYAT